MKNAVIERISRLENLLRAGLFETPVFVRFITVQSRHLLAVNGIQIDGENLVVAGSRDSYGETVIPVTELVEAIAFRDARGAPVFLHDFEAEGFLPTEIQHRRDREAFVYAAIASEEYRLVQSWLYDVSHGHEQDSQVAMSSTFSQHHLERNWDDLGAECSEVLESLKPAA